MNTRLIRRDGPFLPGGNPYVDPRTNRRFDGFDAGGFGDQVNRIIKHRLANPKLYPPSEPQYLSFNFVADQLDEYQCQRFGGDPRYCGATPQEVERKSQLMAKGICSNCGGKLIQNICQTCSGKVLGLKCERCGIIP